MNHRRCTVNKWLLPALCGVLQAIISVVYIAMQVADGPVTFHAWNGTVSFVGGLALTAGACTVAAGVLGSTEGRSWLLVLNGLALGALGLIQCAFVRFRVSFLTVALLIIVMAMSIGILDLVIARTRRWFFGAAGVISVAYALAFLALGLRWIGIEPGSHSDLLWLGSYFGFSAICMLALARRLHGHGFPQSGQTAG
jgi:hypothetical protein